MNSRTGKIIFMIFIIILIFGTSIHPVSSIQYYATGVESIYIEVQAYVPAGTYTILLDNTGYLNFLATGSIISKTKDANPIIKIYIQGSIYKERIQYIVPVDFIGYYSIEVLNRGNIRFIIRCDEKISAAIIENSDLGFFVTQMRSYKEYRSNSDVNVMIIQDPIDFREVTNETTNIHSDPPSSQDIGFLTALNTIYALALAITIEIARMRKTGSKFIRQFFVYNFSLSISLLTFIQSIFSPIISLSMLTMKVNHTNYPVSSSALNMFVYDLFVGFDLNEDKILSINRDHENSTIYSICLIVCIILILFNLSRNWLKSDSYRNLHLTFSGLILISLLYIQIIVLHNISQLGNISSLKHGNSYFIETGKISTEYQILYYLPFYLLIISLFSWIIVFISLIFHNDDKK
ncbi:MAG: hypothetical protein ACXAD7_08405 [Candidatus Kariarchaeaceae archaeon]|jgi:hypothetical protein